MDVAIPLEKTASWQEEENFYVGRGKHGIGPPLLGGTRVKRDLDAVDEMLASNSSTTINRFPAKSPIARIRDG